MAKDLRDALLRLFLLLAFIGPSLVGAQPSASTEAIEVTGERVVPELGIAPERFPANVQRVEGDALQELSFEPLTELLVRRVAGVHANDIAGNPFQAELHYRGFTASPLLGAPQGLSVYQDGVRINEPFGDVVNWALIPSFAIKSVTLVPGWEPRFGLGSLGGGLSIQTRSGDTDPGTGLSAGAGSFARRSAALTHGNALPSGMHAFIGASVLEDGGWRDDSPSQLRQLFGKLGQHGERLEWNLALTHSAADLTGNGLLPRSLYSQRREQVYTRPDSQDVEATMATFDAAYWIDDRNRVSALVHARTSDVRALNADVNADYTAPGDPPALDTRSRTDQQSTGVELQWSRFGAEHQLLAGAGFVDDASRFDQSRSAASFDASRAAIPTGPDAADVRITGRTRRTAAYASDVWSIRPDVDLSASTRYSELRVSAHDDLAGGAGPNLDGTHRYGSLNRAAGASWRAAPFAALHAGYSEGSRVPTPIELGCADPAAPCRLPNAMQSDPELKQVKSRTAEAGARGSARIAANALAWSASAYRSENRDDILFVGTAASGSQGFFQNFGRTERHGVELALSARGRTLDWHASYGYVRAVFASQACLVSPANSSAGTSPMCAAQQILVQSGDEVPGIPRHHLDVALGVRPSESWRLAIELSAFSGQFLRGNENNRQAAGPGFEGTGRSPGYALFHLGADHALDRRWSLQARVTNLFDRSYFTGGQLGTNRFGAGGSFLADPAQWRNEEFLAPGAPRVLWMAIRYRTGPEAK